MLFAFLAGALLRAQAAPIDITTQSIPLVSGTVQIITSSKGLPSLYVSDRQDQFFCVIGSTQGQYRRTAEKLASYLETVVQEAPDHPNARWQKTDVGPLGPLGITTVAMCDFRAATVGGNLFITIIHTRACFGSAGCNYDYATVSATPAQVIQWASMLRDSVP